MWRHFEGVTRPGEKQEKTNKRKPDEPKDEETKKKRFFNEKWKTG